MGVQRRIKVCLAFGTLACDLLNARCRIELLDDPNVDAVYNPVRTLETNTLQSSDSQVSFPMAFITNGP